MNIRRALLSLTALACVSCYTGPAKLPVETSPLPLLDSRAGVPIEECLIVPRYTTSTGISSAAGHGPGNMKYEVFLAHPFVYSAGDGFHPYQGEASGAFILGTWSGTAVLLDGVTVIAPGYKSQWVWNLWNRGASTSFKLTPLERPAAIAELAELRGLLSGRTIEGQKRLRWSFAGEGAIVVRLSPSERERVLRFLDAGTNTLRGGEDDLGSSLKRNIRYFP